MSSIDPNEREIRRLRRENKLLRSEIRRLKLKYSYINDPVWAKSKKAHDIYFKQNASKDKLFSKSNFAAYLISSLKDNSFFLYYQRVIFVLKKYAVIRATLGILFFLWAFLQSSALFVLFTGTMAITAPLTVLFSYVALVFTFKQRKKLNRAILLKAKHKKITVLFPSKGRPFEKGSYFSLLVNEMSNNDGMIVIIVSPYFFSPRTVLASDKKHYLNAREICHNVIIVRKHYYFSLKKHVHFDNTDNLTFIF